MASPTLCGLQLLLYVRQVLQCRSTASGLTDCLCRGLLQLCALRSGSAALPKSKHAPPLTCLSRQLNRPQRHLASERLQLPYWPLLPQLHLPRSRHSAQRRRKLHSILPRRGT